MQVTLKETVLKASANGKRMLIALSRHFVKTQLHDNEIN